MNEALHSIDIDAANFATAVLEASRTRPVVLDFWAPWCGPCKTLMPLLERLAADYQGAFLLAKVNIDDHGALAREFAVRSVPTVKVIRDGAVVDGFLGAQPEQMLRELLARHVARPSEALRETALELAADGETAAALELLAQGCEDDPDNPALWVDRLGLLLDRDALDAAERLIAQVPRAVHDADGYTRLAARLALRRSAPDEGEIQRLQRLVACVPDDCAASIALGRAYAACEAYEEAMQELLRAVRIDRGFDDGAARRALLEVFAVLGDDDPRVRDCRRALAAALN